MIELFKGSTPDAMFAAQGAGNGLLATAVNAPVLPIDHAKSWAVSAYGMYRNFLPATVMPEPK